MAEPLIVVGAGGFGRETLDVVEAVNAAGDGSTWTVLGVVDEAPSEMNLERLRQRDVPFLGSLDAIPSDAWVALAVGSPKAKARLHALLAGTCAGFATLIHPTAVVGSRHSAGEGAIVCAQVSIGTNVTLGRHVHLNPHAVVGHDTRLNDCVSVNPNATISGDCVIEEGVLFGAAAVVLQGLTVGAWSVVGAGACAVTEVPVGAVVMGVPAR